MLRIKSGYGDQTLPLWAVFNLYVIFICTSIPGLAISPIMGDLTKIFPGTTALESQLLQVGPNFAAIPFVFLGGWIGTRFNNNKLTLWTCVGYSICSICFFFVNSMFLLILLSFLIGIAAGILSPLSTAFIADLFNGKKRTAQYGATSATLNLVLFGSVIATGYLAKINWRLPFLIYLLPIIPIFFAKAFGKYIKEPSEIRKAQPEKKVHYKFSQQVNMGMLIRYCVFYLFITLVLGAISMYLPFRYSNSSTAGDLTSIIYFGIMASGYTLNWCLRIMKNKVAIPVILCITGGFALMTFWSDVIVVGIGILIATYFYGIAQPAYYNRLSVASSRIALTLTLAWFASMDSIGNVVAPFLIDGIAKVFHSSTQTHPIVAFRICLIMCVIVSVAVILYKIYRGIHNRIDRDKEEHEADDAHLALATAGAPDAAVKTTADATVAHAETAGANVASTAAPTADSAASSVKNAVSSVGDKASDAVASVKNAASSVGEKASDAVTSVKNAAASVGDKASDAVASVKNAASSVGDKVSNAFNSAENAIKNTAEKAEQSIQNAAEKAEASVASTAEKAEDAVKDDATDAADEAKPTDTNESSDSSK